MDTVQGACSLCCTPHRKSLDRVEGQRRSSVLDCQLREWKKRDEGVIKLLLLGCAESGKSTITKQMRIIHINGFSDSERQERIQLIRKNVKDAILSVLGAMQILGIPLGDPQVKPSVDWMMNNAVDADFDYPQIFYDHVKRLWKDKGVLDCHSRSNEYQIIDSAKYFLDRLPEIQKEDYLPTDQDMLRCRVITNIVQTINFAVKDRRSKVHFKVFDVGGQRGQRRKWLQMFDGVTAVIFVLDVACFDLMLREDGKRNRMLEAAELFHQIWNNRWLRKVPVILFLNKIDLLDEKLQAGHTLERFVESMNTEHPLYKHFQAFSSFSQDHMTGAEVRHFLEAYPAKDVLTAEPRKSRTSSISLPTFHKNSSRATSIDSRHHVQIDVIRTAVFIKRVFMGIVCEPRRNEYGGDWHSGHDCEYYYTCAVDTQQIEKVLESCRSLIINRHLHGWGLIS